MPKLRIRISCMAVPSADADVTALERRVKSLDRHVAAIMQEDDGVGMVALAAREPIRFYLRSPFPEDNRFFGAVDLNIDKYEVDDEIKCHLVLATGVTGVIGHTKYGWLYMRDSRPPVLREASEGEVKVVPHLLGRWESSLEERDVIDFEKEHEAFLALLAPYDLRDGHDSSQPFTLPRGYVGRGWHGIIKELVEDLMNLGWNREVLQIKEKYGRLRFYITQRDEPLLARIDAAREHSGEVCEVCGKAGSFRTSPSHWYFTRCDPCWNIEQRRFRVGRRCE